MLPGSSRHKGLSMEVTYWEDQARINSAGGVYVGVTYPSKNFLKQLSSESVTITHLVRLADSWFWEECECVS